MFVAAWSSHADIVKYLLKEDHSCLAVRDVVRCRIEVYNCLMSNMLYYVYHLVLPFLTYWSSSLPGLLAGWPLLILCSCEKWKC